MADTEWGWKKRSDEPVEDEEESDDAELVRIFCQKLEEPFSISFFFSGKAWWQSIEYVLHTIPTKAALYFAILVILALQVSGHGSGSQLFKNLDCLT